MLKKLFVVVMVLLLSIFAVACSDEAASKEDDNDTEKQEANKEKEAADKKEQEAAKKEKSAVPSDEELTAVLDENVQTLMDKDLEGHMKTIHSESPAYDQTEKTIEMLEPYEIDIILDDVSVEDKFRSNGQDSLYTNCYEGFWTHIPKQQDCRGTYTKTRKREMEDIQFRGARNDSTR